MRESERVAGREKSRLEAGNYDPGEEFYRGARTLSLNISNCVFSHLKFGLFAFLLACTTRRVLCTFSASSSPVTDRLVDTCSAIPQKVLGESPHPMQER